MHRISQLMTTSVPHLLTYRQGIITLRLEVRAESIERALGIAEALYPGVDTRLVFPIEPEGFFVEDPAAAPEPVEPEMAQGVAG